MNIVIEVLWLLCRIFYCYVTAFVRRFIPPRPKSIKGKVVLVTGAGRGIGRIIAIGLAKEGAQVAVWDIDENSSLQTSNLIQNLDGVSVSYQCDVTKPKEVAKVAERVRQDLGEVDILVNNAGVLVCKDILDLEEADIRRTMEVNTIAHFWTVKEFLPHMLSKNSGHIITIASMAAKMGTAFLTDYCCSKFAADGFSKALYAELKLKKKTGIQMTTVYPMFVETRLVTDVYDRFEARDRFNKMLTPEQVANEVICGALRNQRYVYIPSKMGVTDALNAMPYKAQEALGGFLGAGFFPKSKSS